MNQLNLHKKINEFFASGVSLASIKKAQNLLKNEDAKRFFFFKADESWISWFWKEGLLDKINSRAEDPTVLIYHLPELDYLTKIAEKNPIEVTEIINSVTVSEDNFNPEVIDRFLWIISTLPSDQIKILTPKIKKENWLYLMRGFHKSGYEFEQIIKKLVENKESEAILELAQALLVVKSKKDISAKAGNFYIDNNSFYASDLDASNIWEALSDIEEPYIYKALHLATGVMSQIVKLSEPDETNIFSFTDLYSLYDVDFFTLDIENTNSYSQRENVKNLAALIKILVAKKLENQYTNSSDARKVLDYIDNIPSCRSMWRLRLFTISQCPNIFKTELKDAFFKVFNVGERYFEIEGGAEYHQALINGFKILEKDNEQREYVSEVFKYFNAKLEDKDKEKLRKRDGLKILIFIKEYLTIDEKRDINEIFGCSIDTINITPKPSIGKIQSGFISHKSPVVLSDFTVDQIINNLKSEWKPEKLNEEYKNDDFLSPRGVEGLGDEMKDDIKKRTDEYLLKICTFFDRDEIHSHYLYSLLRGIEEMLRNQTELSLDQINKIFELFEVIKNDGEKKAFRRIKDKESWLADWIEVHKVITDILLHLLKEKNKNKEIHSVNRKQIKDIITYLFTIEDSPSKENEKPEYGEPYHIAINSVRGRTYEAFVVFTENDGEKLDTDIKEIYIKTLTDNSLAVRFVIGRYLSSFYFRDKIFITKLLPEIFPNNDISKKDIYLASWEGYLSNVLYDKLFVALNEYYDYAISLNPKDYTQRKYSKGLDESLAIHLALAFIYFKFKINNPLLTKFWGNLNTIRHQEFISFIGRNCLTKDIASNEWLSDSKIDKNKLLRFWNWSLLNVSDPEVLSGFGFWINPSKEILDDNIVIKKIAKTLKKSDGAINWDYGLLKRLPIFSKINGSITLEIISLYLLDSNKNLNKNRKQHSLYNNEIKESIKIIFTNGDTKTKRKVSNLINILIEKGSNIFWSLEEIVQ